MGADVANLVSFVCTESIDLLVDVVVGGVVIDDPFPVGVGLLFEGGPGSGKDVGGCVVCRSDDTNH